MNVEAKALSVERAIEILRERLGAEAMKYNYSGIGEMLAEARRLAKREARS